MCVLDGVDRVDLFIVTGSSGFYRGVFVPRVLSAWYFCCVLLVPRLYVRTPTNMSPFLSLHILGIGVWLDRADRSRS